MSASKGGGGTPKTCVIWRMRSDRKLKKNRVSLSAHTHTHTHGECEEGGREGEKLCQVAADSNTLDHPVFADNDRLQEFICDVLLVAALDCLQDERSASGCKKRVLSYSFGIIGLVAFAFCQCLKGKLDALPTLVAIHRIVAPCDRGNGAVVDLVHVLSQLFQIGH